MAPIIKIPREGRDIDSTDPNDFIFNSDFNTLKIVKQGTTGDKLVNFDGKYYVVAHELDHIPICYAFAKYSDGKIALPFSFQYDWDPNTDSLNDRKRFWLEVDDTYVYFMFNHYGTNYYANISYFIFEASL